MIAEVPVESPGGQTITPNPAENVDRIREILFGPQMREYAQRFLQIEERLSHETGELKAEIGRRLESTEAHSQQQSDSLADRLNTERTERAETVERIFREISDSFRLLDRRLRQADEQVSKDLRELSQLVLDRHRSLSDQLTQSLNNAGALHNRRLDELRATVIDRFTLADLLAEFALRLRGEFRIPGEKDSPHAGADR
jgi:DNA anti-recombination protein RmuC